MEDRPGCPSPYHDTLRAALGQARKNEPAHPRCVCPKAMQEREKEKQRRARVRARKRQKMKIRTINNRVPDVNFSRGACRTVEGLIIMDDYFENPGTNRYIDAARKLCDHCPIRRECGEWVAVAEQPAGSWEGMIAGWTPRQRERIGEVRRLRELEIELENGSQQASEAITQ